MRSIPEDSEVVTAAKRWREANNVQRNILSASGGFFTGYPDSRIAT